MIASTIVPSLAYSATNVKFANEFNMDTLVKNSSVFAPAMNVDLPFQEQLKRGILTIKTDSKIKKVSKGWGMKYSEVKNYLKGDVFKINNAFTLTYKNYAVDKDLNKLTMIVTDSIEIRKEMASKYSAACKSDNTKNPDERFLYDEINQLWYGSRIFDVTHNIDISFIKEDGTLYKGPVVMVCIDFDRPIEKILIKKSTIKNNTLYVPKYKSSEWWLKMENTCLGGEEAVMLQSKNNKLDSETFKTGFAYEPIMSSGHIQFTLKALGAYNNFGFLKNNKGGIIINKIN